MQNSVQISEVGPRDGLQSISTVMSLSDKKKWVLAQFEAGTSEIEVGSFVPARVLPQMADTAELTKYSATLPGLTVAVLAPNLHGVKAAVECGADKISIPFSMSESHSIKNVRKTHAEMLAEIAACANYIQGLDLRALKKNGQRPMLEVGLSTAFGCTIEGEVPEQRVIKLAEQVIALGVDEVGLSDTTGMGNPAQLKRLANGIWQHCGRDKLNGAHLHNTRGQGLANALMAVEIGMTTLDSSLAGLGGCPFAPGASGNIVTEDLVFMLEAMGVNTGINLDKLMKVRELLQTALPNEQLYGFTPAAGLPKGWPH